MKAHNDNDELSFITIGMAVSNVVRYLELNEKRDEHGHGETDADRAQEQKGEEKRDYILHRLRDIETFERRAKGLERFRGKRMK